MPCIKAPRVLGKLGTSQGLPKSNHRQEAGISHADEGDAVPFDRRAIPPSAEEGYWHAADGHAIRRIDWRRPLGQAKGSILFFPGRGDCYEKYLETLDHWACDGWRVTASDWRGQAGSGRLGNDAVTGHVGDFAVWVADLAHFWRQWTAENPGPHVLAGHSMGGHVILRAASEQAVDPEALVLSAPMLGFHPAFVPDVVLHLVAKLMVRLGDPRRPAWKWSEKPGEVPQGREHLLTHDHARYEDELYWREHRPELAMGPGSWGWVERAYASMRVIDRPGFLERVVIPVYVVATDHDQLVEYRATERAVRRLPRGEMFLFGEEARHEILREVDAVRDLALEGIDGFLTLIAAKGES